MTFTDRNSNYMYSDERPVSWHFLRRRARLRERQLEREYAQVHNAHFRVVKTHRGPYRWMVVKRHG